MFRIPFFRTSEIFLMGLLAAFAMQAGCRLGRGSQRPKAPPATLLIGCDGKTVHDTKTALTAVSPEGDRVLVFDVSQPFAPRLKGSVEVNNSVWGPPTNLALGPGGRFALVSDSMKNVAQENAWTAIPNDKLHVVDLRALPMKVVSTVKVGLQPSGVDVSPSGQLALTANRKGQSVSRVGLFNDGLTLTAVLLADVPLAGQASDVRFTPDGKRALVTLFSESAVAVLKVDGQDVKLAHRLDVVPNPYPLVIAPNGKFALVTSMGATSSSSDGQPDLLGAIDLESDPPKLVAQVLVGDSPEGLAISPTGQHAATVNLRGSSSRSSASAYHRNATVSLLSLAGAPRSLHVLDTVEVGALAEGIAFSPDGEYLYVGNFSDQSLTVLRISENKLVAIGQPLALGCRPASLK
ncbi:MAG: YncE family protein [Deltaproteobacteria bacterium]|nr:YncE family protein [Deltaproteobacteria bacterium]